MKKIIISEDKEHLLYEEAMLEEMFGGWGDKVKAIKDYLDKNFARAAATMFGEDGKPQIKQVVAWLDDYKQVVKTLTEVQLFYIIQDQFKKIIYDKKERDKFLIQVLKDWYNNKITKNYSLSVY
jgi:uncharacterized protein (DUF111 family)